jgi:DNA-binding GntR family transcriptional regulator
MTPTPLPLRAQAYENFRQQILRANVRPGQFITQRELVQLLDMPLGAVRELVPRLEAEGLLRTVPQRGLQIAHVDLKLVNNAFALRRLLECEAAVAFARVASDADLATLEAAHLAIVRRARQGGVDDALLSEATALDWGLHDRMIDALGNELVSDIYRVNSLRVRLIRLEGATMEADVLQPVMQEHLWIVQALKARDEAALVARTRHHIDSAHRRVLGQPRPEMPWSMESLL